jgi:hypothetical protein
MPYIHTYKHKVGGLALGLAGLAVLAGLKEMRNFQSYLEPILRIIMTIYGHGPSRTLRP